MLVTSVTPPTPWAGGGGVNPLSVSGWAKVDPSDFPEGQGSISLGHLKVHPNEIEVQRAVEGELVGNWRWPPRA